MEIVSASHFVYGYSRKMFFMLYYFNRPNVIVRLSLLLEILGNMCNAIVCFQGCDVINSYLSTQIVFLLDTNFNILGTKGAFKVK